MLGNACTVRVVEVGRDVKDVRAGDVAILSAIGSQDEHGFMIEAYAYDAPETIGMLARQVRSRAAPSSTCCATRATRRATGRRSRCASRPRGRTGASRTARRPAGCRRRSRRSVRGAASPTSRYARGNASGRTFRASGWPRICRSRWRRRSGDAGAARRRLLRSRAELASSAWSALGADQRRRHVERERAQRSAPTEPCESAGDEQGRE